MSKFLQIYTSHIPQFCNVSFRNREVKTFLVETFVEKASQRLNVIFLTLKVSNFELNQNELEISSKMHSCSVFVY